MIIKQILDEIAAEPGSNAKMDILRKHVDNDLLKKVIYHALSKRVKFYIKQIPTYNNSGNHLSLNEGIDNLIPLIKREKTGHDGIKHLMKTCMYLSLDDAYVLERIIDKDLKIGMGTSSINKVFKGLIEKTPYMGAKSFSEKLARKIFENGGRAYSQVKMDGRYANAIIRGGEVELLSRSGETTFVGDAQFLEELGKFDDCVLNGELTIDGLDRYTANGVVASIVDIEGKRISRGEEATTKKIATFEKKHGSYQESISKIRYTVWDMITVDEYFENKSTFPYATRILELQTAINNVAPMMVSMIKSVIVTSYEKAMIHFKSILARGLEGTIIKSLDGAWKDGKPNWQVKMKLEITLDLKITGFQYGTPGTKNENVISTLHVESSDGLIKTNPAGMTEDMMRFVTENQQVLMNTIVEIRCSGLSQDHDYNWSTLHPSVVKLRDDKDSCDSLQSAKVIENMAKTLSE